MKKKVKPVHERYSPGALERRRRQAREAYRKRYAEDPDFREQARQRKNSYYRKNAKAERKRQLEKYRRNREEYARNARVNCWELRELASLARQFRYGEIAIDEFDRRYRETLAQLDDRIARKSAGCGNKGIRSGSSESGVHMCERDSQIDEAEARRDQRGEGT